jgi:hypothetical protein
VRPGKNIAWPYLSPIARRVNQKGLAVRQAALLTYELLRGEQINEMGAKRWFEPVSELSDTANRVLYDGLQGSPLFKNVGYFFHRLEAANRCGGKNPSALRAPASQTREYSVALSDTADVIRRFNRDTQRLATRVLGALVFAILVLGVLIQERDPKSADLRGQEARTTDGTLLNAPAMLSKVEGSNGNSFIREITSRQATTSDQGFTALSTQENASPQINHSNVQGNESPRPLVHGQDSPRVIRPKIHIRHRSSVRFRFVDVKMRLIALWHQSLVRSENSRIETKEIK